MAAHENTVLGTNYNHIKITTKLQNNLQAEIQMSICSIAKDIKKPH